jgi:hypothetical protein
MSMPLFAYFTRVGLGLLALLLVLNSMLEAEKSEAERAVPAVETPSVKEQSTVERRGPILSLQRSEATNYGLPVASYASLEQRQQLSMDEPKPSSVPKVKFKRKSEKARVPTRREKARVPTRRQEPSAYASYARDTSYLSAVDRHAPR